MNNLFFIFFVLFSNSCSKNSYITNRGFRVHVSDFACEQKGDVEFVTETLVKVLVDEGIWTQKQIFDVLLNKFLKPNIYVLKKEYGECVLGGKKVLCFGFKREGKWFWGLYTAPNTIEYSRFDCIGRSSLTHELIHYFDYRIDNFVDIYHIDYRKYKEGCLLVHEIGTEEYKKCVMDTIEYKAKRKVISYLCGE